MNWKPPSKFEFEEKSFECENETFEATLLSNSYGLNFRISANGTYSTDFESLPSTIKDLLNKITELINKPVDKRSEGDLTARIIDIGVSLWIFWFNFVGNSIFEFLIEIFWRKTVLSASCKLYYRLICLLKFKLFTKNVIIVNFN